MKNEKAGVALRRGAVVEEDHLLAFRLDRDRGNPAPRPGTNAFRTQPIEPTSVREDSPVKLERLGRRFDWNRGMEQAYSWPGGWRTEGR